MKEVQDVKIPEISDTRLAYLAKTIKPLVSVNGRLFHIRKVDLRGIAYTWSPKVTKKAGPLIQLRDIRTLHRFGFQMLFKPSIAEVLAQIPDDLIHQAVAFEIINSPHNASDLSEEIDALNAGFHVAKTRLYGKPRQERTVRNQSDHAKTPKNP